jgi:hypothetical protein
VDGAPAIIRKTWEQYQANNGNGMVNSIDQVLRRSEYSTNLATEFPKFTWNNYFMITGTYNISYRCLHQLGDFAADVYRT